HGELVDAGAAVVHVHPADRLTAGVGGQLGGLEGHGSLAHRRSQNSTSASANALARCCQTETTWICTPVTLWASTSTSWKSRVSTSCASVTLPSVNTRCTLCGSRGWSGRRRVCPPWSCPHGWRRVWGGRV